VRGVAGGVGRVDAVPDHRRLVADGVDPGQQPGQQVGVPDVPANQLVRPGPRDLAVGLRKESVEQHGLVPLGDEPVRDVGPDETGSAGDENAHEPTLGRKARERTVNAPAVSLV